MKQTNNKQTKCNRSDLESGKLRSVQKKEKKKITPKVDLCLFHAHMNVHTHPHKHAHTYTQKEEMVYH